MSIVPYHSDRNNRIVYHDLSHQIVVVHNHEDNSFSLFNDLQSLNHYNKTHGTAASVEQEPQTEVLCPNCGIDLLDFLGTKNRPGFRRRSSNSTKTRKNTRRETSERSAVANPELAITELPRRFSPPPSIEMSPVEFMHRDYFKLLADATLNSATLAAPGDDSNTSLPSDLFNQGYFERFFRKIPPGILGSGASAQVYKVVHVLKDIQLGVFAVKRINVGDHSQYLDHVLNEVLILYELSVRGANEHNLIRYNHVWMETGDLSDLNTIFLGDEGAPPQSERNIVPYVYILQQYCDGGHLEHMMISNFQREMAMLLKEKLEAERARRRSIKNHELLKTPSTGAKSWLLPVETWKFFHDIVNGVLYLHSHGILHRDLKPSNCLLESVYDSSVIAEDSVYESESALSQALLQLPRVLVSDFGEGKFIDKQRTQSSAPFDERRGNTGTVEFTDPKLWVYAQYERTKKGKRKFAHKFTYDCDIYSLGMILCYLCVGTLPFSEVLSNTNDPEAVRNDISTWHKNLTVKSFGQWFDSNAKSTNKFSSAAFEDFKLLAYMMIKGELDLPKPSAENIVEYLQSMRESNHFIKSEKPVNVDDSRPMSDLKLHPEEDGIEEEDTLDLLNTPQPSIPHDHSHIVKRDFSAAMFTALIIACLAAMELIVFVTFYKTLVAVKLGLVLGLVAGLQNENFRLSVLLVVVLLTVSFMLLSMNPDLELYKVSMF
ncbi:hypothetical protein PUMCH_005122 [Australozyma saopauloensis]|uniref:Protein kinase domain-containing protein n=1 Tax=Australozyma saopauloensis TaxID=291208 RepID=A0AAX4HGR2_9ASCO|nr:hypothetical protein PUMCH_005122 [[Candida] saopauloensis]